jgi:hypothetical protein
VVEVALRGWRGGRREEGKHKKKKGKEVAD